jgi:hypothetical protein
MASASFSICAYRISVSDIDLDAYATGLRLSPRFCLITGCRVDPDKVKAIVEMKRPDDISGIRRFLGMVNQLNKFSPKITELTKPLHLCVRH